MIIIMIICGLLFVCLFFHLFCKTNLKIEMIGNKIKFMEEKKTCFSIKYIILINHKKT